MQRAEVTQRVPHVGGIGVWAARCPGGHPGWSAEDVRADYRLVLVRRGRFRRRVAGVEVDLDPTVGYLGAPGEAEGSRTPRAGTCAPR